MPVLPALCAVVLVATWAYAVLVFGGLPARIPVHYGFDGTPDAFGPRAMLFLLPALATVLGGTLGFLLPAWVRRLAAADSKLLNVPHRRLFSALPAAERVRAVQPVAVMVQVVAIEVAALFLLLLYGTHRVATGAADGLPPLPTWGVLGTLLATVVVGCARASGAVRAAARRSAA